VKNISFDKNILYIGDKNIVFEDEIFQVKIEDDKIYVLLDIKPKEKLTYDDCNNVFCYSGKGRKIWQIGVRPKGNPTVYTMINFDDILRMRQKELKHYLSGHLKKEGYEVISKKGFLYAKGDTPVLLVAHLDTVHQQLPSMA